MTFPSVTSGITELHRLRSGAEEIHLHNVIEDLNVDDGNLAFYEDNEDLSDSEKRILALLRLYTPEDRELIIRATGNLHSFPHFLTYIKEQR